jgi:ribosomal protein L35
MEVTTKGAKSAKDRMNPLVAKHLRVLRALRSHFIGHTQQKQITQLLPQRMLAHSQVTYALTVSHNAPSVSANGLMAFENLRSVYKNLLTVSNYKIRISAIGRTFLAEYSTGIDICPPFTSVITLYGRIRSIIS